MPVREVLSGLHASRSPLEVTTPLGEDVLLLSGFTGHEAISQPFFFQLECVAENANTKKVAFDELLGQNVTVEIDLPGGAKRYFNGICHRVAQGGRDADVHAIPARPRPAALAPVPEDTEPDLSARLGPRHPEEGPGGCRRQLRDPRGRSSSATTACSIARPTSTFASRLMEEEGIYYFFKHTAGSHTMVVANTPGSHPDILRARAISSTRPSAGGTREEDRVNAWEKAQELRSSKVTLWDHCFELPHKHLEAERPDPGFGRRREVEPQAEARSQRQARALRLPRRVRPALRRQSTRAAATSRRRSRRSSRTTPGPRT